MINYERLETPEELTKAEWSEIWSHFNRLQKRVMANKTTKAEFFTQSPEERIKFYEWMMKQCGEYACYM